MQEILLLGLFKVMLPGYKDGPSNTLLSVIREEADMLKNWKGYRELTEK